MKNLIEKEYIFCLSSPIFGLLQSESNDFFFHMHGLASTSCLKIKVCGQI